jgi:hypothetical protein
MQENLKAKSFQPALIPKGLKTICKVLRGNLRPLVEGVGVECLSGNGSDSFLLSL